MDDIISTFLKEKKSFWMTHNHDADNGHIVRKQGWWDDDDDIGRDSMLDSFNYEKTDYLEMHVRSGFAQINNICEGDNNYKY